jgi:hypothetical protein
MKSPARSLLIFSILALILPGCEKNSGNNEPLILTGKLVNIPECKSHTSRVTNHLTTSSPNYLFTSSPLHLITSSTSCVQHTYDKSKGRLTLKHINAGFNCCPDSITCEIILSGSTLEIHEKEASFLCNCSCLYDLDIEIDGIFEMQYTIKFIEPYASEQLPLLFGIDLKENSSGEYCVVREGYPWGM